MNEADLAILDLTVTGMHCESCVQRVTAAVGALAGVEAVNARVGGVRVEYYPQAVSREGIEAAIRGLGYGIDPVGDDARRDGFLARMARTNQELFGGRRLDCCTLNRPAAGASRAVKS